MSRRTRNHTWFAKATKQALYRAGYDLRRHPAARRSQYLRNGAVDLVLDVGASVGQYARELRRFGYMGPIASFEPLQTPFTTLSAAASTDPIWSVHNLALGDKESVEEINVSANSDSSSILPMLDAHTEAAPQATYVGTEVIRVDTLDHVWDARFEGFQRPFLKLDTQGYERQVLDGALSVMDRLVGIQIELSFRMLYADSMLYTEASTRLQDAGLTLVNIEPGFADARTGELLQADGIFMRT
jgi:FkbM family methyltransferase